MINLDEFLNSRFPNNAYVDHNEFSVFYVKKGARYIEGVMYDNVFVLSRIEAKNIGSGTLRRFLKDFWGKYDIPVMVECVLNERLAESLPKMGFKLIDGSCPPSFYKKNIGEQYV